MAPGGHAGRGAEVAEGHARGLAQAREGAATSVDGSGATGGRGGGGARVDPVGDGRLARVPSQGQRLAVDDPGGQRVGGRGGRGCAGPRGGGEHEPGDHPEQTSRTDAHDDHVGDGGCAS